MALGGTGDIEQVYFQRPSLNPLIGRLALTEEEITKVPDEEGVFQLMDEKHKVTAIKGTADMRQELLDTLEDKEKAAFFEFEEDKIYSKRGSEMIQKYLQEHGEMPGGMDDNDDLF